MDFTGYHGPVLSQKLMEEILFVSLMTIREKILTMLAEIFVKTEFQAEKN